jgi:hypothetical protein
MSTLRGFLVLAALAATAGCIRINVSDKAYKCGPGNSCPTGYACGYDNYCYRDGHLPTPPDGDDLGGDEGDMAIGNIMTSSIPSQANSKLGITIAAPPLLANGTSAATVTMEVNDVGNQPVAGALVSFGDDDTHDTLSPASVTTDAKGHASTQLTSTAAGQKTVKATVVWVVDGARQSFDTTATITFNAVPSQLKSTFKIDAPPGLLADGRSQATLTVVVNDADGNPIKGIKISFVDPEVRDAFTPPSAPSDAAGKLLAAMTSEVGGDKSVKAHVEWQEAGGTAFFDMLASVTFLPDAAASNSTITPATNTTRIAADGSSSVKITAVIRDGNNVVVPSAKVTFSLTGAANAQDVLTQSTMNTDANGSISATLTSTLGVDHEVRADVNVGTGFTLRTTVGFDPIPDKSQSIIALTSASIAADGNAAGAINVSIKDRNGLPVFKGVTVQLSADGGASVTQTSTTPDSTGGIQGACTSTSSGSKKITALVSWNVDGSASNFSSTSTTGISFTAVASPGQSDIVFARTGVIANKKSTVGVTVHVRDFSGTAMANQNVTLSATGAGTTSFGTLAKTDLSGAAQTTMLSDAPGDKTVTLAVNGVALTQATYTFAVVKATTLVFSPHLPVPPNTVGTTFDAGILATDQDGQSLTTTQVNVVMTLDQTTATLSGTTSVLTSTSNGIAGFHLTIATPGTYTMTATAQNADSSTVKVTSDQFKVAKPTLTPPTITAVVNAASSITVSWSEPDPATCTLQRADNGSSSFSTPSTLTCASSTSCTDPFLRRGSYVYRVACTPTDGSGNTVFSQPSASQQPGTEVCVTNGPGNSVIVHALNAGNDTVVRTLSAQLNNPWGIAVDLAANEIFVTNINAGTVDVFDRTATGVSAQPKRILTLTQLGAGGTGATQPTAIALDAQANELVVLEHNGAAGPTLAGFPRDAANSTTANWFIQGAATGMGGSFGMALDKNNVYVSNSPTSASTITTYTLASVHAAVISAANHAIAPSATMTGYSLHASGNATFNSVRGMRVDPTNNLLFITNASPSSILSVSSASAGIAAAVADPPLGGTSLSGISGPFDVGFLAADSLGGVSSIVVLSKTNGNVGIFPESASGDVSPSAQFNMGANAGNGVVICN